MSQNNSEWVVVVSETIDGETTCQVVSEFETEQEAQDFACDLAYSNPKSGWEIEVCTAEEAEAVVTD